MDMDTIKTGEGDVYAGHYHHNYADRWHDHKMDYAPMHHHHDEYAEEEHEHDEKYASKGTAGAALGLGIAGTALGVYNAWRENNERRYGRGRDRGYDGDYDGSYGYGRGRDRGCDCCEENKWWFREEERIRHYEMDKADELAATRAALAASQSERFAEQGDFKNYKALSRMIEEENEELAADVKRLAAKVCDLEKFSAVSDAKADGKFEVIKESLKDFKEDLYGVKVGAREELKAAITLEAERRECGDRELQEWTNCNFVRNKKVLPIEEICPQAMPRFNAFDIDRIDDCGCRRERREERQERGKKSDKE